MSDIEPGLPLGAFTNSTAKPAITEAWGLIYKDRRQDYSDPRIEFEKIAALWTDILGVQVTPHQYILCMIGMKLIRESGNHKRDNIIDLIGYAQLADDLRDRT